MDYKSNFGNTYEQYTTDRLSNQISYINQKSLDKNQNLLYSINKPTLDSTNLPSNIGIPYQQFKMDNLPSRWSAPLTDSNGQLSKQCECSSCLKQNYQIGNQSNWQSINEVNYENNKQHTYQNTSYQSVYTKPYSQTCSQPSSQSCHQSCHQPCHQPCPQSCPQPCPQPCIRPCTQPCIQPCPQPCIQPCIQPCHPHCTQQCLELYPVLGLTFPGGCSVPMWDNCCDSSESCSSSSSCECKKKKCKKSKCKKNGCKKKSINNNIYREYNNDNFQQTSENCEKHKQYRICNPYNRNNY